jgi:hypothetical protein
MVVLLVGVDGLLDLVDESRHDAENLMW